MTSMNKRNSTKMLERLQCYERCNSKEPAELQTQRKGKIRSPSQKE